MTQIKFNINGLYISASYYQKDKWSMLWPESETITVPPNDIATVDVTLVTPTRFTNRCLSRIFNFQSESHK